MRTVLNNQQGRFISRNDRHLIRLNGVLIDESPCFSLSFAVWQNFSGERHIMNDNPHYSGGFMVRHQWEQFHEQRLGLPLHGLLELIHEKTQKVIHSCNLLGH